MQASMEQLAFQGAQSEIPGHNWTYVQEDVLAERGGLDVTVLQWIDQKINKIGNKVCDSLAI